MSHLLGSRMIVVNGNGSVTEDETCEVELAPAAGSHLHGAAACRSWAEQSQRDEPQPCSLDSRVVPALRSAPGGGSSALLHSIASDD